MSERTREWVRNMGLTHSKGERGNNAESREKEEGHIHMRQVDLEGISHRELLLILYIRRQGISDH